VALVIYFDVTFVVAFTILATVLYKLGVLQSNAANSNVSFDLMEEDDEPVLNVSEALPGN